MYRSSSRSSLGSVLAGVFAAAVLVGCASNPARAQRAGGTSPQGGAQRPHRGHRSMGGGMRSDAAARLLDHQSVLGLSGDQVTRLIAVHQQSLANARPIRDKMMAMFPHTPGQRPQITPAQRDSVGAMMESLREIRWRTAASADSVLTDDQRKTAMRMVWRARGGGGPGGPGMRGGRPQRPDGEDGSD